MGLGCERSGGPWGLEEAGGPAGASRRNIWGIWGMLGICGRLGRPTEGSTLLRRLLDGGGPRSELLEVLRLRACRCQLVVQTGFRVRGVRQCRMLLAAGREHACLGTTFSVQAGQRNTPKGSPGGCAGGGAVVAVLVGVASL